MTANFSHEKMTVFISDYDVSRRRHCHLLGQLVLTTGLYTVQIFHFKRIIPVVCTCVTV